MLSKTITIASLIVTSLGTSALTAVPAQAQVAPYFQCVKNVLGSSGIAARVKWYEPNSVTFIKPDPRGDNADTPNIDEALGQLKTGFAKPMQEEVILVAQQSCVAGLRGVTAPRIAIVSVVGGKFANEAVKIAVNTLAAGVGLVSCPVTAGAGCAAAVAIASGAANAAASLAVLGVPEAKEVFYIGFPGQLEVKGTAFNPQAVDKTLGVASLPYEVNIDLCLAGMRDTNTGNKVTVDFMAGNSVVQRQIATGAGSGCEAKASTSASELITSVRVNTDGGDAMLIDQVRVYRDGGLLFWDGRDNGGGWCLSTDANDHIGGWEAAASGCRKSHSFSNPAR